MHFNKRHKKHFFKEKQQSHRDARGSGDGVVPRYCWSRHRAWDDHCLLITLLFRRIMRNSHNGPYHISWHWHYCEQSNSGASHTHSLVLLRAAAGFLSACVSQWAPPLPGITQHSWTLTTTFQHLLAEYISVSFCSSRPFASSAPGHHLPSLCDMWSPTSLPSTSVTQHPCSSPLSSLFLCFISCPFYFSFPYIYFLFCCFLDIFFLHLTILTFPFSFFYFLLFTLLYLFPLLFHLLPLIFSDVIFYSHYFPFFILI